MGYRRSNRLFLIVALLLLAVILIGGYLYLSGRLTPEVIENPQVLLEPTPVPMVRVVVPRQAVPANTVLNAAEVEEYFETQDVPRTDLQGEYVISSKTQLLDKVTRTGLNPGELLYPDQFAPVSLSYKIPEGKRAFPLEVDLQAGVVGEIAPDDYVDIIFSGHLEVHFPQQYPPLPEEFFALAPISLLSVKTILQDIQVLKAITLTEGTVETTGQPAPEEPEAGEAPATPAPPPPTGWVMLLAVDDSQAELLQFARDQGMTIQLVLRARDDHDLTTTGGVTTWILVNRHSMPVPRNLSYEISPGTIPSGIIP